jgi:hypothetical protein
MNAMNRSPSRLRQRGQSTVEYVVVAGALVGALFIPVDGHSMAQYLSDNVRLFFTNLTYFISLP